MNAGRADQIGTPAEIYNRPATSFVANFVGTLNILKAMVTDRGQKKVSLGGKTLQLPGPIQMPTSDGVVSLALRPEALSLIKADGHDGAVEGVVSQVNFMGSVIRIRMDVAGEAISFDVFNNPRLPAPAIGQKTLAHFSSSDIFEVSA